MAVASDPYLAARSNRAPDRRSVSWGKPRLNDFKAFMTSDAGALARYRHRLQRRVHLHIDDIEPQSKKMSLADRTAFQTAVAVQLAAARRSTFRGDVALKLDLATTSKTAPQAHTIAKNLLDLLGTRQTGVPWPKRSLLYGDDRQIRALSVTCRHGEEHPSMRIEARPFAAMLDDLELAAEAVRISEMNMQTYYEQGARSSGLTLCVISSATRSASARPSATTSTTPTARWFAGARSAPC